MGVQKTALAFVILTVWMQFLVSGCSKKAGRVSDQRKAEQLATEQGKLSDLRDPVAKTKSYIKMSEILLDFAADAARSPDMRALRIRLDQYAVAVRSARDTMVHSERTAKRRSEGFKDLELALRGQITRMEQMSRGLSVDQRPPVDAALDVAKLVRNEVQRLLHPDAG